jgi:hypothetical protein
MSKKFVMIRVNDIGGVSGTGHVLDGIKFSNGKVAVAWLGKGPVQAASVAVWDSFEDFINIHVNSHPGNEAKILWEDDPEYPTEEL